MGVYFYIFLEEINFLFFRLMRILIMLIRGVIDNRDDDKLLVRLIDFLLNF